jgi:choline dehydrogenase-like flavoprotein
LEAKPIGNLRASLRYIPPNTHWDSFTHTEQPFINDRKLNFNQGMALGGSSAMNACIFVPPSRDVMDGWEKLGNPGWNWDAIKPYFQKAFSMSKLRQETKEHLGISWPHDELLKGPTKTSYPSQLEVPLMSAWNKSFQNIGYQMTQDPFSGVGVGSFPPLSTVDPSTKERSYSATEYYKSAAHRENLHVLTGAIVEKVLLQKTESSIEAIGVQFLKNGATVTAEAQREVILAAGALQSPKLLELSGIGNATIINKYEIEVLINNPYVGENLQDHPVSRIGLVRFGTAEDAKNLDPIDAAMARIKRTGAGPFKLIGCPSYAYLPVMNLIDSEGQATLESLLDSNAPQGVDPSHPQAQLYYDLARHSLEHKEEASAAYLTSMWQNQPTDDTPPERAVLVGVMLSQPLSRGTVHIASSSPTSMPLIDPKYFSNALDLEIYARQVQYLETIASSEPFHGELLKLTGAREPAFYLQDLEVAKEYVRRTVNSMWHPCGTCAMLPREKGGVVDERLVVYGTANLRVVDASVMPLIPRANPQATVYAVAERVADLIKEDHGLHSK